MDRAVRWAAVAAWMALIFILSAQPHLRVADEAGLDFVLRKAGHLLAFGTLAVLLHEALEPASRADATRRGAWTAFALTVVYAITDEAHQAFVAGRGAAATDVLIDVIGAAGALAIWTRLVRPRVSIRRRSDTDRPPPATEGDPEPG